MKNRRLKNKREDLLYLSPGLSVLAIIFLIPLLYSIGITFVKWTLIRPELGITFVGLNNYFSILTDSFTYQVLARTFIFLFFAVIIEMILGLLIATVLNWNYFGYSIVQSICLIPFMMAPIVVGFSWKFLLNNTFGPIPQLLTNIGLGSLIEIPLLANSKTVLLILILVDVWQFTPFVVLVLLAGMKSLPIAPFEAAEVDGATSWQKFKNITLPLLKSPILVALVMRTLTALRVFDTVSIMTAGGPGSSSEIISFYGYRLAFQSYKMGMAGTIGIITMIIALGLTISYLRKIGVDS